jgi:hypothetical protein
MNLNNEVKVQETTPHGPGKPHARMALTVSGLLVAGCTLLLGQPGNAQSERFSASTLARARCAVRAELHVLAGSG